MAMILPFIGLLTSLVQMVAYYRPDLIPSCGSIGCSAVSQSQYGALLGYPISSYAFIFFASLIGINSRLKQVLYGAGAVASLVFLYLMFFKLNTVCYLCVIMHGCIWAGLFLSLKEKLSFRKNDYQIILFSFMLGFVLDFGLKVSLSGPKGNTGDYTITVMSDYQCPSCKKAFYFFKELKKKYPKISIEHKHFPLNSRCNPHVGDVHSWACEAATISICAKENGFLEKYQELVFENQEKITLASDILLLLTPEEQDKVIACQSKPSTAYKLQQDVDYGEFLNLRGTPMIIYQKSVIPLWYLESTWDSLLR